MANVLAKHCIYDVDDVEDAPTTSPRRDAPHVAMANQQRLDGIHGKLKTLTGKESDSYRKLL